MRRTLTALSILAFLANAVVLTGCTQLPTEKQSISDMRPQISFRVEGERAYAARVVIDGLDMGSVSEYLDGQAALRVLSGTHMIRVSVGGTSILEEKVYLGDGVSRSFILK
jgi:hypothetical protein